MKRKLIILVSVLLLILPVMLAACSRAVTTTTSTATTTATPSATATSTKPTGTPNAAGEIEATEFQGIPLTAIVFQRNNALAGTQQIDRATYKLTVDGLVNTPITLTYDDLLALPQQDRLMPLNCVEGWSFTAKWTGPSLNDIFMKAGGVKPEAKIVIFYTADDSAGYSSLDLAYIVDNEIIIALKDNDITLTADRGFPFQVVAMSKYGYKWSKWITRIELSDNTNFKGYWESFGYNNNGDDKGPAFD